MVKEISRDTVANQLVRTPKILRKSYMKECFGGFSKKLSEEIYVPSLNYYENQTKKGPQEVKCKRNILNLLENE